MPRGGGPSSLHVSPLGPVFFHSLRAICSVAASFAASPPSGDRTSYSGRLGLHLAVEDVGRHEINAEERAGFQIQSGEHIIPHRGQPSSGLEGNGKTLASFRTRLGQAAREESNRPDMGSSDVRSVTQGD